MDNMIESQIIFKAQDPENASSEALILKAADILMEFIDKETRDSFRTQENALAHGLAHTGREVTRRLLQRLVEPQPEEVLFNGKRYRKVLSEAEGSCRVSAPHGLIPIKRALYREVGQRGVKGATTIGLLELRAGIIEGATPRMAEIMAYYDAVVTSRESEKLMDLAGLQGPRRSTLEKKAGLIGGELAGNADALLSAAREQEPLPEGAATITIGMDRVTIPYEEPNPEGKKSQRTLRLREKKPYQRREPEPIARNYRGDFIGNVSIRDQYGELVGSYVYGLSHAEDPRRLADWLAADVVAAIQKKPDIRVSVCQDGARELWPVTWEALARRPELVGVKIIACVDFHHFSPRAREMVRLLWGADAYPAWERRLLDESNAVLALHDAVLLDFEKKEDRMTGEQLKAIHDFTTYIDERTRVDGREDRRSELFDYASLRASGLPIGSGPTEASCKSMAAVRMKRCGNRWGVPGAQATLMCRGLILSTGRWDIVWPMFANSYVGNVVPLFSHPVLENVEETDRRAA